MSAAFEAAKAMRDRLQARVDATGEAMKGFPKSGRMNLTPDHVKSSPEYQVAKYAFDQAFANLRNFNRQFVTIFADELRAERRARRA